MTADTQKALDAIAQEAGRIIGFTDEDAVTFAGTLQTFMQRAFDLGAASPAPGTRALIEARYELLKSAYVAADFDYPQYAGMTCLIFAFDGTTRVSRDLDKTLDGAKLCAAPPAGQGSRSV